MRVQGNTVAAVQFGVSDQLNYTGQKMKLSDKFTAEILKQWDTGRVGAAFSEKKQLRKALKRRVKNNVDLYAVQPVGFWQVLIWPLIYNTVLNAVVNLLIDWLMSDESQGWKAAQVEQ